MPLSLGFKPAPQRAVGRNSSDNGNIAYIMIFAAEINFSCQNIDNGSLETCTYIGNPFFIPLSFYRNRIFAKNTTLMFLTR